MRLNSFDDARILCVDYRYEREAERMTGLLKSKGVKAKFFIDGRGDQLPRSMYSQLSKPQVNTWIDGTNSFNHFRAFKRMVAEARDAGHKTLLIAEDDLILTDNFDEIVSTLQVPDDWDMIYYGANHTGCKTQQVADNLLRCFGSKTTHLVAFKHTIYEDVLSLPPDKSIDWNIGQRLHEHYKCYAVYPAIALQKPGYSQLWKRYTDYTELFKSRGIPV